MKSSEPSLFRKLRSFVVWGLLEAEYVVPINHHVQPDFREFSEGFDLSEILEQVSAYLWFIGSGAVACVRNTWSQFCLRPISDREFGRTFSEGQERNLPIFFL